VEAAEEGLLLGESAEYTASQAHQPTTVPTTHPEDDDAPALDSWTGLPNLSIDVEVDRHRIMKEVGRNYSFATPSLPHRRHRQKNQAAEESCSTGKI
jgi:hypothetical protein